MQLDAHTLAWARRARDKGIRQQLLANPNVLLIDIGYRIRDRDNGRLVAEPRIRFHLRQKLYGAQFEAFAATHREWVIPETIDGFKTDAPQAPYRLQAWWGGRYRRRRRDQRAEVADPMRGGISISDPWRYSYGTLGGLVIDRFTGEEMLLSNFHVLASLGYARSGTAIYQPGRGDGGTAANTIATFTRHAMRQGLDAAVATLNDRRPLVNDQMGLGPVTGDTEPQLGMRVCKSGRRSDVTHGIVTGIEGVQKMRYRYGGERLIRHVIHIAPRYRGTQVSAPGDSGSWWLVDAESHRVVGLHFAGCDRPEYALALAMPRVLEALHVDIVTEVEDSRIAAARHRARGWV